MFLGTSEKKKKGISFYSVIKEKHQVPVKILTTLMLSPLLLLKQFNRVLKQYGEKPNFANLNENKTCAGYFHKFSKM